MAKKRMVWDHARGELVPAEEGRRSVSDILGDLDRLIDARQAQGNKDDRIGVRLVVSLEDYMALRADGHHVTYRGYPVVQSPVAGAPSLGFVDGVDETQKSYMGPAARHKPPVTLKSLLSKNRVDARYCCDEAAHIPDPVIDGLLSNKPPKVEQGRPNLNNDIFPNSKWDWKNCGGILPENNLSKSAVESWTKPAPAAYFEGEELTLPYRLVHHTMVSRDQDGETLVVHFEPDQAETHEIPTVLYDEEAKRFQEQWKAYLKAYPRG